MKFSIDISDDLRDHLEKKAKEKKIKQLGKFIKAVLKKATNYKEKELVWYLIIVTGEMEITLFQTGKERKRLSSLQERHISIS